MVTTTSPALPAQVARASERELTAPQELVTPEDIRGPKVAGDSQNVEEKVREYFKDEPVLVAIARCESNFRQNDTTGNTLRGRVNPADLGVMQVNEKYHAATAIKLGHDLHSIEGNLAYAKYLYESQGTRPWNASRHCWRLY